MDDGRSQFQHRFRRTATKGRAFSREFRAYLHGASLPQRLPDPLGTPFDLTECGRDHLNEVVADGLHEIQWVYSQPTESVIIDQRDRMKSHTGHGK